MRIALLIRSLRSGGAERQLSVLARGLHARGHIVRVMTFYPGGPYEQELIEAGVPLVSLDKSGRWDFLAFWRFMGRLRAERPDVLHSYLPTPNIVAALLKPFLPRTRVVFGVRASGLDLGTLGRLSRWIYRLEAQLARLADLTIANSEAGALDAVKRGFPGNRTIVVPNGIDTERFCPEPASRADVRAEWGIPEGAPAIGIVARLDPLKGHPIFLQAAGLLAQTHPDARFVIVGDGPDGLRDPLATLARATGIGDRVVWAGARRDMAAVYSALDIATSASVAEGFPNVIGEAMACGVPCVVTDVGDSAAIVGDLGLVVPSGDPAALAAGWARCLAWNREDIARQTRARIVECFSVDRLSERTEAALQDLLVTPARAQEAP